jgi:hypothetical protein
MAGYSYTYIIGSKQTYFVERQLQFGCWFWKTRSFTNGDDSKRQPESKVHLN